MKASHWLKTYLTILASLLVMRTGEKAMAQTNPTPQTKVVVPFQQKPGDLLAGFTRAVCYSGYRHGQHPDRGGDGVVNPTEAELLEDLKILGGQAHMGLIRLYDAGRNSEVTLKLIRANKLKIKVMLGAWLAAEVNNPGCPWQKTPIAAEVLAANKVKNAEETDRAIRLAKAYPDVVVAVNVGNEVLVDWNDHMVPVDAVIAYVRKVKAAIQQPVTVADNYAWWAKNGAALAKELDFIVVHSYPEWEGKTIDEALAYTIQNVEAVHAALPQSRIVIGECGWATVASEFGPRASEENQKRYVRDVYAWAAQHNVTTFIFEAFDEDWKGDPGDAQGAEKHWGLFTVDRKPKQALVVLSPLNDSVRD